MTSGSVRYSATRRHLPAKYEDAVLMGEEVWRGMIENGSMIFAVQDGRAVRMVVAVDDGDALRIVSMYVSPPGRGLGVGRRLMETVIRRHRGRPIVLDVNPEQGPARRLYQSLGFVLHLRMVLER